jgi:hypothetical protein
MIEGAGFKMRFWHWNTKDEPTNCNLQALGQMTDPLRDPDPEWLTDRFRAVIVIEKMLPKVVHRHFRLPSLFIGGDAYRWSKEQLKGKDLELSSAIAAGLEKVEADQSLLRDGDADFSDRPPTKGEEIADALEVYRDRRDAGALSDLRIATSETRLASRFSQLEHWLGRKRPSAGGQSIEYEIASVLGDIGHGASHWHHLPASWRYREKRS